jgi:hypothetical protein
MTYSAMKSAALWPDVTCFGSSLFVGDQLGMSPALHVSSDMPNAYMMQNTTIVRNLATRR